MHFNTQEQRGDRNYGVTINSGGKNDVDSFYYDTKLMHARMGLLI